MDKKSVLNRTNYKIKRLHLNKFKTYSNLTSNKAFSYQLLISESPHCKNTQLVVNMNFNTHSSKQQIKKYKS